MLPFYRSGLCLIAVVLTATAASAQTKPKFETKLVSRDTPGKAADIDVDVTGAKKLFLVVTDGGDSFACDWADWIEPRLIGPKGETKLTDLKWKSATAQWGKVQVGHNAEGGELKVDGKPVAYGIGTHANSVIEFDLPEGTQRFKARGGLDNGGTNQGNGSTVTFAVYLDQAPKVVAAAPQAQAGSREPLDAVAGLEAHPSLQATLFAAEPMTLSPANIDVDHLGRVWVCEVVNYRGRNGQRPEGDRILILEDTDHDGKADKQTVFYQGRDVDTALGICVLGNRVIVSVAPNVFVFTDENGDGKADKKELLFTKVGQPQHDHSTHAFVFGPDGKFYWNVGNTGMAVHDKDGKPITDLEGNVVNAGGKPYRQGLVFRCNPDGSDFEVLGHNFRNNFEVTVDSFGTLWQSDNDDDGNRGVRINYVMEHGNFGYTDEITGSGWQTPRTNIETEVPLRHWHLNDPGVVPNLLQTGGGSPTGICVYEGKLLPKEFQNQVIHCDAGPNVCRAYPVTNDGAGYKATMLNVLEGTRDKWFRPSDVCVAPDGSLIVADWYDPGVGGHAMGDIDKGRIFRVAPSNAPYAIPKYDFKTVDGAMAALDNPNLDARYLAWTALHGMGEKAEPALTKVFESSQDQRLRARALWLLSKLGDHAKKHVEAALKDANPDIRITALRAAREWKTDATPYIRQLANDASPQVRRECALALRHSKSPEAPALWADLAGQHDGKDRWYLEALGIGADQQWDAYLGAWLKKVGSQWNTPAGRDIIWRSRAAVTPEYLARIVNDPATSKDDAARYLRAYDFLTGDTKDQAVIQLAFATSATDEAKQRYVSGEALNRLKGFDASKNPQQLAALNRVLDGIKGSTEFVTLVDKFKLTARYPELLTLAQEHPDTQVGVEAVRTLLNHGQEKLLNEALAPKGEMDEAALNTARALTTAGDGRTAGLLKGLMLDAKAPASLRQEAVRGLAKTKNGAMDLLKLAREKQIDPALEQVTAFALHSAMWDDVKKPALELYPLPPGKNSEPLPPLAELLKAKGNADKGKQIFATTGKCATCHIVKNEGKDVGPNLTEIGSKLSREAMFESILFPSAGISHNYETYVVVLKSGNTANGIMTTQTPDSISLKGADAIVRTFKKSEIEETVKQSVSLMPADLQKEMSAEDLINVVEYISTLKKAK